MNESTTWCPIGHPNSLTQKFCEACGLPIIAMCPNGHQISAGARYCSQCGTPLTGSQVMAAASPNATRTGREKGRSGVRIGATYITRTGQYALIRGISGNDVWADLRERNGTPLGTVRFPISVVETEFVLQQPAQPLRRAAVTTGPEQATPIAAPSISGIPPSASARTPNTRGGAELQRNPSFLKAAAIAAALIALGAGVAVWLGRSDGPGEDTASAESGVSSPAGTSPVATASTLDDWLSAVCKPGSYRNGNNRLPNAQAGGTCISLGANGMPILIGQYESKFGMDSDIAMFRMRSYAAAQTDGGLYQVFIALGRGLVALQPLSQYGFVLGTAG